MSSSVDSGRGEVSACSGQLIFHYLLIKGEQNTADCNTSAMTKFLLCFLHLENTSRDVPMVRCAVQQMIRNDDGRMVSLIFFQFLVDLKSNISPSAFFAIGAIHSSAAEGRLHVHCEAVAEFAEEEAEEGTGVGLGFFSGSGGGWFGHCWIAVLYC